LYKISVIIPTYNRAAFITKAIDSVLNQTIKVDEIIVVDDGSCDNTKEVLQNYNIIYKYIKNSGVSKARNTGIKLAKNRWIMFLDSDDTWEKTKVEKQVEFHKINKNIYFSHTDELWIYNNKIIKQKKHHKKPSGFCFDDNLSLCKIGASTVMIRRSVLDDIGLFDEELIACEDYDLWLRILTKYELGYIDEKLIEKIAGHKGQLSFETPLMDLYRLKALSKHTNNKKAQDEFYKKKQILLNGAIKHNNIDLIKIIMSPDKTTN
jgi:glycosyltransferase involved in cell wall biosynthesis